MTESSLVKFAKLQVDTIDKQVLASENVIRKHEDQIVALHNLRTIFVMFIQNETRELLVVDG